MELFRAFVIASIVPLIGAGAGVVYLYGRIEQLATRADAYGRYARRVGATTVIDVDHIECPSWVRRQYIALQRPAFGLAVGIVAWMVLIVVLGSLVL